MNSFNFLLLLACVTLLSLGQLLFKLASDSFPSVISPGSLLSFAVNKYLLSALVIYGFATFLWVWALSKMPLSLAYPFMALAFIIVPILSYFALDEPLSISSLIGGCIIVAGLAIAVN
ncbi:MAG: EamA family transporter [Cycloclasticus sp.]|nr:hypothetical protein A9Q85_04745 [Cycloclasticus sp. 44_32_T64]